MYNNSININQQTFYYNYLCVINTDIRQYHDVIEVVHRIF